jgi:signal transduction histidine kinase
VQRKGRMMMRSNHNGRKEIEQSNELASQARKANAAKSEFLRSLLKDAANLLALGIQEKGPELVCLVEPTVPSHLCGDPGRLRHILVNLGSNDVKFTEKGKIVIHVSRQNEDERTATVRFSTDDTGICLPGGWQ